MPSEYTTDRADEGAGGEAGGGARSRAESVQESPTAPRRVRQNSAPMMSVPIERAAERPPLGIHTPAGVTMLALVAWMVLITAGAFPDATEKFGMLIASVTIVLMLSAVHELGHVLAGGMAGLELRSFTVGPFTIVRERRGLDAMFNGHWIRFAGCVEHDVPPGPGWRTRLSISALGGPAANLLVGASLLLALPPESFVHSVALWSCFYGGVNLVPLHVNGQTSDGGLVWRLWSRSPKAKRWRRQMTGK